VIQQLNGEELKELVLGFLHKIGRKTKKLRNKKRSHAYRISNKLCEELRVKLKFQHTNLSLENLRWKIRHWFVHLT